MVMKIRYNNAGKYNNKHDVCGAAAVEFALLLVLLLMIVAGAIEFGRTFWYYDALTKATRDGARFLSTVTVDSIGSSAEATSTPADCTNYVPVADSIVYCAAKAAGVPNFDLSNVDVFCGSGACVDGTKPTNVTVQIHDYQVIIGGWIPVILPTGSTTWAANISPSTTMRYMK